jgi:hypothetical protein
MTDKEKRTKKYTADQRHKKRRERMAKSEACRYPAGAVWVDEMQDEDGNWVPRKKPFAMRTNKSRHSTRYSYFKNYSNRAIRRNNNMIPNGNGYRKIFDYQWTVD